MEKCLLNDVNKLFVFKSLLTMPSNVLPLHLKQTFLPIIWIFTEGEDDGNESRLPSKIFSTLQRMHFRLCFCYQYKKCYWESCNLLKVMSSMPFNKLPGSGWTSRPPWCGLGAAAGLEVCTLLVVLFEAIVEFPWLWLSLALIRFSIRSEYNFRARLYFSFSVSSTTGGAASVFFSPSPCKEITILLTKH